MALYYAHYSEKTSFKPGECPCAEDIIARQNLLRENKLFCVNEIWVPGYGISPVWEGPELNQEEQDFLCIKKFEETPEAKTNMKNTREFLKTTYS